MPEWPCTCLPAPFDEQCDGCRKNALMPEPPDFDQIAWRLITFVSSRTVATSPDLHADLLREFLEQLRLVWHAGAASKRAHVVRVTEELLADGPALSAVLRQCLEDAAREHVEIVLQREGA